MEEHKQTAFKSLGSAMGGRYSNGAKVFSTTSSSLRSYPPPPPPPLADGKASLDDFSDGIVAWLVTNTKAVVPLTAYAGGRLGWSESRGLLYTP